MKQVSKLLLSLALVGLSVPAMADSFWNHNGSVMRLTADGNNREFTYEEPTDRMIGAGVTTGTVLFTGKRTGNRYSGTAYVFSKDCDAPLPYKVSGTVQKNETKVVMTGTRKSYGAGCRPTGRTTKDTRVFTYMSTE